MKDKCVFAGSFDPVTNGHLDIIGKCAMMFEKVYVVLAVNAQKTYLFDKGTRLEMLKLALKRYDGVEVFSHDGMIVDFMKKMGVKYYARGIRDEKDVDYENAAFAVNSKLYPELETLYIPCGKEYSKFSSSVVREKLLKGENVEKFLPYGILPLIYERKKDITGDKR